jgi:regulator of sigma E protease
VLTILSTVVVLSILILVHELGHFLAAKAVNIQVPRFSLGFGKALWGFRWGETEFVISAIPLGGYVKMAGMEDDEAAEALEGGAAAEPVDPERTFDHKPLWARTLVITAGVIMNMLFAWLVYSVVTFAYGDFRVTETRVAVAAAPNAALDPQLAAIPQGARVVSAGGEAVTGWSDISRALRNGESPVELRFADAPPVTLHFPGGSTARDDALQALEPFRAPVIEQVEVGSPAARAGLRPGDRVLTAAGTQVRSWQQLVSIIQERPRVPIPFTVQRDGKAVALTITPDSARDTSPSGDRIVIGRVGAGGAIPAGKVEPVGVFGAVASGARKTWITVTTLTDLLKRLVTGQLSPRTMGGLLSIGQASGETARLGLEVWLDFLAMFSVNLAILNLLPIPILDGGHLMFLAFEAVRGRPLSVEARIRLSQVGLVIVVALMLWANGNDVVRLIFGR